VLEDAIALAAHNFTRELRAAYNEAEITSRELARMDQQAAGLIDHQAASFMTPSWVIDMPIWPPLAEWQHVMPESLRSATEEADRAVKELLAAERTAMDRLGEQTLRLLAQPTEMELAEQAAADLARVPLGILSLH
jgi:hypothetical protein